MFESVFCGPKKNVALVRILKLYTKTGMVFIATNKIKNILGETISSDLLTAWLYNYNKYYEICFLLYKVKLHVILLYIQTVLNQVRSEIKYIFIIKENKQLLTSFTFKKKKKILSFTSRNAAPFYEYE